MLSPANLPDQLYNSSCICKLYMNSYHYLFKFIVIGDSAVGKSSIVLQFLQNKVQTHHDATIGVQFGATTMQLHDKNIKLQIWDTAGQQNFRSITRSYYRSAIGALLVYDITRRQTFEHVKNWIREVKNNGNTYIEVLLVEEKRTVSEAEGRKMAEQNGIAFIEISARDYSKVRKAFKQITQTILNKVETGVIPLNQGAGVKPGDSIPTTKLQAKIENKKKKKCC